MTAAWFRPKPRWPGRVAAGAIITSVLLLSWCTGGHGTERKAKASFYSKGRHVACRGYGQFDPEGWSAAHRRLSCGTKVEITNPRNNRKVVVVINDRGPFRRGRELDVSLAVARALGVVRRGVFDVTYRVVPAAPEREPTAFEVRFTGCQPRLEEC
jgi:rare lipoprotein A